MTGNQFLTTLPTTQAVARIAPIVHKLIPYGENIAQLAALSLAARAAFVVLVTDSGTQIVGSHGLGMQRLPQSKPNCPEWLIPIRPHWTSKPDQLEALGVYLGCYDLQSALGVAVITPLGAVGALWVLDLVLAPRQDQKQLMVALAKQLTQFIELEGRLLDLEQPHRIVQARDFAQSIIQTVSVGMVVADAEGKIEYTNPAFEQIFGFSLAETRHRNVIEFILPKYHDTVREARLARQRGESSTYRYQMYCQNGAITNVEVTGHPRFAGGKYIGTVATVRDISQELKTQALDLLEQTQHAVAFEREVTLSVVETAQEGFVISKGMNIEYVNQKFAEMVGLSLPDLVGKKLTDFVHPEDLYLSKAGKKSISLGQNIQYQQRIFDASGKQHTIKYIGTPRRNTHGQIIGAIGSVRDITHELEIENNLENLRQELRSVKGSLQSGAGFSGQLEIVNGTIGLLQMLATSSINGEISVEDGVLYLLNGKIVAARHQTQTGKPALESFLGQEKGVFSFKPNQPAPAIQFELEPIQVILEYLTQRESSHQSTQLVVLPNQKAAQAFMAGVGGQQHFQTHREKNQIHHVGRGFRVVVLETNSLE
jgi:PAS domain S-box-containing protein